jgi:glycine/D-amino acid oxidase-like deaminating enzyme
MNDQTCGWINGLPSRNNVQSINKNLNCDWIIVGAGYTGLSAARKLGNLHASSKIILVDSQLAGEGASSRNSGYLVDTTLNDGFTSNKNLHFYKKKTEIYKAGIEAVKKFIKEHQVNCDWNECGKYFASSQISDQKTLENFSKTLNKLNFNHKVIFENDLKKKLGTSFYKVALYTNGGILINPAKLVRAMINTLPKNVELFENSHLNAWKKNNGLIECDFENYKIICKKIIFCANGFLSSLGIKKSYNFPLILTASMTRPLTDMEYKNMGGPKEWGVLPVKPMGATVRFTKDRRILIRNTAEINKSYLMDNTILNERKKIHKSGIQKRFPNLPLDIIETTWSGVVCRSRNSSQLFEKIDNDIFVAGCYNGSGIGNGVLFGEQIALKASRENTKEISLIENRVKPTWLPPQPFLNLGIKARLFYERFKAKSEI